MKKTFLLVVMLCMLVISGCSTNTKNDTPDACEESACENATPADMSGYEGFSDANNQFISITMQDATTKIKNKESAIFYFGYPTCPWCIEAVPVMNEVAKETKHFIYYIDTKQASDEERTALKEAASQLWTMGSDGKEHFYVPQVIVTQEGSIVSSNMGTVSGHNAPERKMTNDEISELKDIYTKMFKKIG